MRVRSRRGKNHAKKGRGENGGLLKSKNTKNARKNAWVKKISNQGSTKQREQQFDSNLDETSASSALSSSNDSNVGSMKTNAMKEKKEQKK